ncbi:MAG TPA: molybdate ABC transporter substrate-binding protein [Chloroflexia bacterium]|nr:molybdate ABC transporter substrate-binding protein [Chloroflexia bacterium]
MSLARLGRLCTLAFISVLLAGCGGQASVSNGQAKEVVIFAASSLKEAFEALAGGLKENGVEKVDYNFAGSQALVAQLSQGAKGDVFASADVKNMESAIAAGSVVSGTQRVLATNKLVAAVPASNARVSDLKDLAEPGLKLVLADKSVPAGNYSLQALDKLSADPAYGSNFKERVLANVVSYESNVRQVLSKVELGEADAGIVYATDARAAKVSTIEIEDKYNVVARYYIAPLKDAAHAEAARAFIEHALSEEGQRTLESYGFGRTGQDR